MTPIIFREPLVGFSCFSYHLRYGGDSPSWNLGPAGDHGGKGQRNFGSSGYRETAILEYYRNKCWDFWVDVLEAEKSEVTSLED